MSFVAQRTKRPAHGRTSRSLLLFVNCLKGNIRVLKDLKDPKDLKDLNPKLLLQRTAPSVFIGAHLSF